MRRRGFTLVEAVASLVILSVAVPTVMTMMVDTSRAHADSIGATRAVALSTLVLEHVLADVNSQSAGLGFAALADENAYLNTATTGLYDRLASHTAAYTSLGLSYTVSIGPLVDRSGVVTGVPADDVHRQVTVSVTFPTSSGQKTMAVRALVADLS